MPRPRRQTATAVDVQNIFSIGSSKKYRDGTVPAIRAARANIAEVLHET